jgi:hypothetical protein
MFSSFVSSLFGCSHKRTTFPITPTRGGTYVACLECGKEFAYNWMTMQIGEPVVARPEAQPVPLGRPA